MIASYKYLLNLFNKFKSMIHLQSEDIMYPYRIFGIFGLITYPIFHVIWVYAKPEGYENLGLRLMAAFLCIPLIFKDRWPAKIKPYLSLYWYIVLLYALPFFFTFMLLKNDFSYTWALNSMTGLVLCILLMNLIEISILLPLGIFLAWSCFQLSGGIIHIQDTFKPIIITYLAVIICGGVFTHKKQLLHKEKLEGMTAVGSSIAHELRTPLSSIANGLEGIKRYFPSFLSTYTIAKEKGLTIPEIRPNQLKNFSTLLEDMSAEMSYANTIINMLLMKVKQTTVKEISLEKHSMLHCIDIAIGRYPFGSDKQSALIHWNKEIDFDFTGNELMMTHVLFNLIKNALYYLEAAGKGEIYISLKKGDNHNTLYFRDTGNGVSKTVLHKLFTQFFTTTSNGTGLGLYFCKMAINSFGGDISCESEENEYIEFIITLPKT